MLKTCCTLEGRLTSTKGRVITSCMLLIRPQMRVSEEELVNLVLRCFKTSYKIRLTTELEEMISTAACLAVSAEEEVFCTIRTENNILKLNAYVIWVSWQSWYNSTSWWPFHSKTD